jgi:hypothetical protein
MNRFCLRIILLVALMAPIVRPQTAADAPATRDDILALFNLMHVRDQVEPAMQFIAKQQRAIIHDNLKRQTPRISPEDLARLDQFTSDIMKDLPVDGMLDDMVPVYQSHLTRSDVDAMSAFYSSLTGQKLLRETRHDQRIHAAAIRASGPYGQSCGTRQAMSKEIQKVATRNQIAISNFGSPCLGVSVVKKPFSS